MLHHHAKRVTSNGHARSCIKGLALSGAALLLVFLLDLNTSNELSLFPLYLLPIVIATYRNGSRAGYLACVFASLAWLLASLIASSYSQTWIAVQGMLSRSLVFLIVTHLLIKNKNLRDDAIETLDRLKSAMPICPDCGKILCYDGNFRSLEKIIVNPLQSLTRSCNDCQKNRGISNSAHHCSPAPSLRLLHVIQTVDPKSGGPIEGIRQIAQAHTRYGHSLEIVSLDLPSASYLHFPNVPVYPMQSARLDRFLPITLLRWLKINAANYDAVIVNGIWGWHIMVTW